ncbi:MAG: glycosyltransferase [Candidatus Magasanikbacteria bacterium]|nr:glycosyltransferase [Candidatus Magasanikbacteria bacterium]
MKIIVTGDNGESLPPPYGGIIKRCLLHAVEWRALGAEVTIHLHHRHTKEQDLGANATYVADFASAPNVLDKTVFLFRQFFINPALFTKILYKQIALSRDWKLLDLAMYSAARGVHLNTVCQKNRPDIMVTETGSLQSLSALMVAKKQNIPVVMENYAEIQFKADAENNNISERYHRLWKTLVNGVDCVVAASDYCARGPRLYAAENAKIAVVYSGINFSIFNSATERSLSREEFNLPKDKFIVMAVGALKMRKGHDQLFESILQLPPEKMKNLAVVLCGMGPVDTLRQTAIELGFPSDSLFIFQGLTEDALARLYSGADAFCFPSITPRECMGMAMKEAMAVGLPVAAYNTGGISEAIEDQVNGFLVPTGDRAALAQAVEKIMELPAERLQEIRQQNINKSRNLFDINKTARQLYDLFQEIIA